MAFVSDTGPIIAFAKISSLHLLQKLLGHIIIVPQVYDELSIKFSIESLCIQEAIATFIEVTIEPSEKKFSFQERKILHRLGKGERSSIMLSKQLSTPLIIDDRVARSVAKKLRVDITGTAGLLLLMQKYDIIPSAYKIIMEMKQNGYWFSKQIVDFIQNFEQTEKKAL